MEKKSQSTAIISGSIDLTAIEKDRLISGKNGKKYLNLTIKVQKNSKYGNNVWITQTISKEEQDNRVKAPSLGNAAVKWVSPEGIEKAIRNEVTNSVQNIDRTITDDDLPY